MRPIPDYENEYLISETGEVTRRETGRVIRPSLNPQNGYLYVGLWKDNKGKTCSVHRLVARTFIPNPDQKPFVNHKDSNRTNANKNNLEWATQSENTQHGYDFGNMSQRAQRRFKEFELDVILQTFLSDITMTAIARQHECGLSRLTINLRKRAADTGLLEDFESQLRLQKVSRNTNANENKKKRVSQYTPQGEHIATFSSLNEAAKALGKKSAGSISNALNPLHPQEKAFGFLWKYT